MLLSGYNNLTRLDMASQRSPQNERIDISILIEALRSNTSLLELNVANNGLNDQDMDCLSDALVYNTTLQKLALNDNNFTDEGASKLASQFPYEIPKRNMAVW